MRFLSTTTVINNSGTSSTAAFDTSNIGSMSAQAVFSDGAAAGSLKFQASNDPAPPPAPSHWSDVGSAVVVAAGATSMLPELSITYRWVRVTFVSTGGAGTISVSVEGEGI